MPMAKNSIIELSNVVFEYILHNSQGAAHNLVFLNGYRTDFRSWFRLYDCLCEEANMLFYNRLGIGKSSKPAQAQDGMVVLDDLRELLAKLEFKPPYVLVAHSLGGIFADLFCRSSPEQVSGLVLVDTPHPDEIPVMKAYKIPLLLRLINAVLQLSDRFRGRYLHSEDEQIFKTLEMIAAAGDFPNIPVAVISGTHKMFLQPQYFYEVHQSFQTKLLQLSPRSKRYLCEKSSHFPQISEPAVVYNVIKQTLQLC